jgi:uncharacterized protein (TIGR02996 family)
MSYEEDLNFVLKYNLNSKSTWMPALSDPADHVAPLVFADWLEENDGHELAGKIRKQVELSKSGGIIKPHRLGDAASDHDFVVHAVRTGHQNPTVRAMASMPDHSDLIDLLLHSDSKVRPHDHDVAVFLSQPDPHKSHSAHSTLSKINRRTPDSGLQAKVVRGTAYLLDYEHNDRRSYGAPAIVFHAPVNDHSEMQALADHAHQLATERAAMDGAQIGPAMFGS